MTDASQTGIRITAKFNPIMFNLFFINPHVGVDGSDAQAAWKQPAFIPTTPGEHTVTVYYPYLLPKRAGVGEITVTVAPGQIVDVAYKAPWVGYFKGKMSVTQ